MSRYITTSLLIFKYSFLTISFLLIDTPKGFYMSIFINCNTME